MKLSLILLIIIGYYYVSCNTISNANIYNISELTNKDVQHKSSHSTNTQKELRSVLFIIIYVLLMIFLILLLFIIICPPIIICCWAVLSYCLKP